MSVSDGRGEERFFFIAILAAWSVAVGISFYFMYGLVRDTVYESARLWARAFIEKDIVIRHWSAGHGGVYVPVTLKTQPNPYLTVPEREVRTPSGRLLTLINPAYMTRQVYEHTVDRGGMRGHITSLRPIRPENMADDWERKALLSFEQGGLEYGEPISLDNVPFYRYMQPFITEDPCLRCHAQQGYKVGDIRGGISVSVPLSPFFKVAGEKQNTIAFMHMLLWFCGFLGIVFYVQTRTARRSERYKWEQALLASESRYRTLAEHAPIGIMQTDAEGCCTFANRTLRDMAGISAADAEGHGWLSAIHPDDRNHISASWHDAKMAGAAFDAVFSFGRDDSRVIVHAHAIPLKDDRSGVTGYIVSAEDITAQRQAEERLRASERRLGLVFDHNSDLLMLVKVDADDRFRILSANRTFFATLKASGVHLSTDRILNQSVHDFMETLGFESERIEKSRERWRDAVRSARAMSYEESFVLPEGEFYGVITLVPILNDHGECSHLLWSCRNITSRMLMMQSLLESEAKYAQLFNAMLNGFALIEIIYDRDEKAVDYRYLDLNPAFERILSLERDEVLGKSVREVSPNVSAEWIALCGEVASGKGARYFQRISHHGDKYVQGYLYSPRQGLCAMVFDDITEQHRLADEKRALEEQLLQSQKMEAVGQLAGGIAHDFNNILTSIISNAYILKKKSRSDDTSVLFVDEILSEAARAANLTKGLLTFSRKQVVTLKPVSVNQAVEKISGLLRRLIGEDIAFTVRLSPHDATVMADEGQLEQVVVNLTTNARDAMPNGGSLTIETVVTETEVGCLPDSRKCAVIRLCDTGTGIDAAHRDRIFEPFYTTKAVGKGTGLGLAIAYGIIKQHRGHISVQSEPGKGSCFTVALPAASVERPEAADVRDPICVTGRETVLLAEDEESVRKGAKKVLEECGYQVLEAGDGETAVAVFREHSDSIGLVILDVIMPRMSGMAVCDEIKAVRPDIKVLLMSGYTADIISRKGLDESGAFFITKPFQPDELLRTVRDILEA